jgi:hypothetical protein
MKNEDIKEIGIKKKKKRKKMKEEIDKIKIEDGIKE